jgi:alkylation response protein AidB-like acyl-CoA dehydrogenase
MTSQAAMLERTDAIAEDVNWLERARKLGPMLDASAAADENATEISTEIVNALDEAGIFAASAPRVLGGGEAHPTELIDLLSEIAYWDGSAGWYVQAVMSSGSIAGACLGPRAVEAIFAGGKYQRAAGSSNPGGTAERVGDSYRISGRFTFGTGSSHAGWFIGGYVLHEDGKPVIGANGQPVRIVGYSPRETVRFKGNWDVLGLRGTGSYDYEVTEQLLHEDFFFQYGSLVHRRGGPLFGMGYLAQPCISNGAFALGAARRMLHEWQVFARGKTRGTGKMADNQAFHRDIGMATAELHAAEAYMKQAYTRLIDAAATKTITNEMKADGRLSASHAHRVALRIAQTAYVGCSTYALRNGNAIQRVFRDIHAGAAHSLTHENSMADVGKIIASGMDASVYF